MNSLAELLNQLEDEKMELKRQLDEYAAELAKYCDAPVVAWKCFGTLAITDIESVKIEFEKHGDVMVPLIVKPGEEK